MMKWLFVTLSPLCLNWLLSKKLGCWDVWDSSREEGGWSPIFFKLFNGWEMEEVESFFLTLHNRKFRPLQEDKLVLKSSKGKGFSVKFMFSLLDQSRSLAFPFRSI